MYVFDETRDRALLVYGESVALTATIRGNVLRTVLTASAAAQRDYAAGWARVGAERERAAR